MASKTKKCLFRPGLSLIEIVVTIVILVIIVIGTSGYRYHTALNARKADVGITATRIASLLLNSWKGLSGTSGYSFYNLDGSGGHDSMYTNFSEGLEIYTNSPGPDVGTGFNELDTTSDTFYRIVINNVNYYTTLSYKDEIDKPRLLNVCVGWMNDYQAWDDFGPNQMIVLSTYASN